MPDADFAAAINCIDGRVQQPVSDWLRQRLGVDYVDMITEPGPDKALTQGLLRQVESIRDRLAISVQAHQSGTVAVVGHDDCAANPVQKDRHWAQIEKSAEIVAEWGFGVRVIGLWVNQQWQVEVVCDTEQPSDGQ